MADKDFINEVISAKKAKCSNAPKEIKVLVKWMIDRLPLSNPYGRYAKVVENIFAGYITRLEEMDNQSLSYIFPGNSNKLYMQTISSYCDKISEIIRLYSDGRGYEAFDEFEELMSNSNDGLWNWLHRKIDTGREILYRLRKMEPSSKVTKEDMFHIPLNSRGKVESQRYSSPGYPCLYLGYSINACWEELGRPSLNSFMVASVSQQFAISIIDLSVPSRFDDFNTPMDIMRFIMSYPLIAACSVKVSDPSNTYKEEYIIPQMLTNYVIKRNAHKGRKNLLLDEITAIKYTSTHYNKQFGWSRRYFTNLAIPVINISSPTKYCPNLCRLYLFSSPTCVEYEQISDNLDKGNYNTHLDSYQNSLWGRLEQTLSNRTFSEIINKNQ